MATRRPLIVDGSPYIVDYFRKSAERLHAETGGNSGNLAFRFAVASHIEDPHFVTWADMRPERIRALGDLIVLPCANQLGAHTDLAEQAAALEDAGLPIVALGLGAQAETRDGDIALTPGTEAWLKIIAQLAPADAPNIGVRGAYSAAQIGKLGHQASSAVIGCPSNFINFYDDIGASIAQGYRRRPRHIAVAGGIPSIPELRDIERNLADIVTIAQGAYIVQHDARMLQIARGEFDEISPRSLEFTRDYIKPELSVIEFQEWCRRHAYAFYDVRAWMDFIRRFDIVIGTRFHGIMLALQAGVPAACIAHDSRTMELCETTGVPVRHYSEIDGAITQHNILDWFEFDADRYNLLRSNLLKEYTDMLRTAELPLSQGLVELERRINARIGA